MSLPKPYYEDNHGVLYHGDCLEIMKELSAKSVDLVLTDPPYRNEEENQPTMDMRKNGGMKGFGNELNISQFIELIRVAKNQIIWGANNFEFLPSFKGFLVWEKYIPEDFTMSMAEIAYISEGLGTISKVFKVASNSEKRYHPTQKPLALMRWCIEKYSKPTATILDPFAGSGTTLRAAKDLGRKYIGIEISEKYCEIAVKRLGQEVLF